MTSLASSCAVRRRGFTARPSTQSLVLAPLLREQAPPQTSPIEAEKGWCMGESLLASCSSPAASECSCRPSTPVPCMAQELEVFVKQQETSMRAESEETDFLGLHSSVSCSSLSSHASAYSAALSLHQHRSLPNPSTALPTQGSGSLSSEEGTGNLCRPQAAWPLLRTPTGRLNGLKQYNSAVSHFVPLTPNACSNLPTTPAPLDPLKSAIAAFAGLAELEEHSDWSEGTQTDPSGKRAGWSASAQKAELVASYSQDSLQSLGEDPPEHLFVVSCEFSPEASLGTLGFALPEAGSEETGGLGSLKGFEAGAESKLAIAPPMPPPAREGSVKREAASRRKAGRQGELKARMKKRAHGSSYKPAVGVVPGQQCTNCQATSTPVWRLGPSGPKTLCNACGVRHMKHSGKKR